MSTYSQIYIQTIFAAKGRESLIGLKGEERLYKYITGIVQKKGQKRSKKNIWIFYVLVWNMTTDIYLNGMNSAMPLASIRFGCDFL